MRRLPDSASGRRGGRTARRQPWRRGDPKHDCHCAVEQFAACRCSGDNRPKRGEGPDHLPDRGCGHAGFPPHPSLVHRLDHDHDRKAQGKPELHLYRGRIRPRWRSGGNRERELYDRPASSAPVGEHLRAYGAHHGALHSSDAPQIVWYYNNAPSNATGALQADTIGSIVQERNGNLLFGDAGTGGPTSLDTFYRAIAPDGTLLAESPADCSVTPPTASPSTAGWVWGQGNDWHEHLVPGADGVRGTVLHLGRIFKDPFFDAGQASQGKRLQAGSAILRWNPAAGTDKIVWDPFNFLDPLTERTNVSNTDPGNSSDLSSAFPCAGKPVQSEEWMHANSLQVAPSGVILMSVRYLDTIIAISPQLERIAWRIGRFKSDFTFPNPSDRFYHEHYVRMLENGNLLLFDNGNGRPAAEGGLYTRALELALDWKSMSATKVWEYRHQTNSIGGVPVYKYSDRVGAAQRLENGNTIVWFGADVDPLTLKVKSPQTYTLVEADASPEAGAVAVLDVQIPPGSGFPYRALPVETLFGEVSASGNGPSLTASPNPIQATGAAYGTTTITWNAPNTANVEIHVSSPNGPLFASGGNQGSQQTGAWVADGTTFYLQDVTGGKPLTASNTLAALIVHLQR